MAPIAQHPGSDLLASFAAGSLPLSQALCVSAHLEYCAHCRDALRQLEHLGTDMFTRLSPAPASSRLRQQVLAEIGTDSGPGDLTAVAPTNVATSMVAAERPLNAATDSASQGTVPRCLRQFIPEGYAQLAWRRVSPSIASIELCRDNSGTKVELLRIKPGGSVATHTHLGDELTVILKGSFSDEAGLYRAGDFMLRDASHHHTPVATHDSECICLAVTEAPIQFTGFFSRWLNPLLRRNHGKIGG